MADINAKTIDNLGPEAHQRFIEGTRLLGDEEIQRIIQTPNVAQRAQVLKTTLVPSKTDVLFEETLVKKSPFDPPENFVLGKEVLTHQLIPSLGSPNQMASKLNNLKETDLNDAEKKQKEALSQFNNRYLALDKIQQDIDNRESEFHKG
jgi:Family of unknown function (DUF5399)